MPRRSRARRLHRWRHTERAQRRHAAAVASAQLSCAGVGASCSRSAPYQGGTTPGCVSHHYKDASSLSRPLVSPSRPWSPLVSPSEP